MKYLYSLVILLILGSQWLYWIDRNGVRRLQALEVDIASQERENAQQREENEALEIDVLDLKNGLEAVEERARTDLGMIGVDETFYLIVD